MHLCQGLGSCLGLSQLCAQHRCLRNSVRQSARLPGNDLGLEPHKFGIRLGLAVGGPPEHGIQEGPFLSECLGVLRVAGEEWGVRATGHPALLWEGAGLLQWGSSGVHGGVGFGQIAAQHRLSVGISNLRVDLGVDLSLAGDLGVTFSVGQWGSCVSWTVGGCLHRGNDSDGKRIGLHQAGLQKLTPRFDAGVFLVQTLNGGLHIG